MQSAERPTRRRSRFQQTESSPLNLPMTPNERCWNARCRRGRCSQGERAISGLFRANRWRDCREREKGRWRGERPREPLTERRNLTLEGPGPLLAVLSLEISVPAIELACLDQRLVGVEGWAFLLQDDGVLGRPAKPVGEAFSRHRSTAAARCLFAPLFGVGATGDGRPPSFAGSMTTVVDVPSASLVSIVINIGRFPFQVLSGCSTTPLGAWAPAGVKSLGLRLALRGYDGRRAVGNASRSARLRRRRDCLGHGLPSHGQAPRRRLLRFAFTSGSAGSAVAGTGLSPTR